MITHKIENIYKQTLNAWKNMYLNIQPYTLTIYSSEQWITQQWHKAKTLRKQTDENCKTWKTTLSLGYWSFKNK